MNSAMKAGTATPEILQRAGHCDDDVRFYDRQQAYIHTRGGSPPRHASRACVPPKPELTIATSP